MPVRALFVTLSICACTAIMPVALAPPSPLPPVWLHAHNCYPDEGVGADRLARALAARRGTVAIEQDIAWDARRGASVLSHDTELDGSEPTLAAHFFDALTPELDRALAAGETAAWPLVVLHLDFKSNEAAHHEAVWQLLGRHERWLTMATRTADGAPPSTLRPGPLLVLTEAGDGQERDFHERVPVGGHLRLFGSVPAPPEAPGLSRDERVAVAVETPAAAMIPSAATSYRRWVNFPWAVVERGGQPAAGAWDAEDRRRLDALVGRAHTQGLWIRFYTLNGHAGRRDGWTEGYNFGTTEAVLERWEAAVAAGVEFIATDQYEDFSRWRAARTAR